MILNPYIEAQILEDKIHDASLQLVGVKESIYKDENIKKHFADRTLNGVDHYIQFNRFHILIQDKWCAQATSQARVAHFLQCSEKIHEKLVGDKYYLIWVCKTLPCKVSIPDLERKNVKIIVCNTSIDELTNLVIEYINEIIRIESNAMEIEY